MPPLGPLVLLVALAFAWAFRSNAPADAATPAARIGATTVEHVVPRPAPAPERAAIDAPAPAKRDPVHRRLSIGELYLPATFAPDADGGFDLLVHFHGVPQRTEPALDRAGLSAALLTVNLGLFSGPYEKAMAAPGSLDRLVRGAEAEIARVLGEPAHASRLALSAWSAGYGAIAPVLARPAEAARVDAVLLADGLHTSWAPGRRVDPARMAPFVAFARRAEHGDGLFAMTHSSIVPGAYASTTDTARFLTDALGVPRVAVDETGPRAMHLLEEADAGDVHVRGYAGGDAPAHCDHLYALGDTLFPWLRARWSAKPAAIGGGPR